MKRGLSRPDWEGGGRKSEQTDIIDNMRTSMTEDQTRTLSMNMIIYRL